MTASLYISTTETGSGKALVSLGIIELILRKTNKVAFFRPVIRKQPFGKQDEDINLILNYFALNQTYESAFGLYVEEVEELISSSNYDEVLDKIILKYKNLEQNYDFILCEGSDYLGQVSAFEFNLNTEIVKNLGCPILIVGNADRRSVQEAIAPVKISLKSYLAKECQVIGIVFNKANPELLAQLPIALANQWNSSNHLLAVIPYEPKLSSPRVGEIAQQLNAEVLYGDKRLNNLVVDYVIAAMRLEHVISRLKENSLVITPGDRNDLVVGLLQAHQSVNYPHLSGILLSGDLQPEPSIRKLIDGLYDPIPILCVPNNTYETSELIKQVNTSLVYSDRKKITLGIHLFDDYVNLSQLEEQINTIKVKGITPKMFTYNLLQQAKSQKRHIVLPEGEEIRILQAAAFLLNRNIVDLTLLGNPAKIEQIIKQNGIALDISQLQIIDPAGSDKVESYAERFYQLRKHKGATPDMAREYLLDLSYFGTMMVYAGDADGMVSGAIHTTQHTLRPALQLIKTKPSYALVSSVFFMCLEDRVLVYGDCAINPNPNAEQLAEIALSSADTATAFGIEPKVALLSYSSGTSGKGEEVEKVRTATAIARKRRPDLKIEGPIQYDAAVDLTVGSQKMPDSQVAGQASVLIFPDLNTGNNTYKAVQRETGALAIGPIVQGLNKPVNDLSRGCTVDDIINTVAITAIQTQI
ncbi:Phosphate acetyltransferase [Hyella patelloides LEGE 07179]|uniref:Phosphate acetyltransferase n=1 Tax=Hyella patelloides LEGE 07179 TaxID=945734 RepID=A0A563VLM9_9CYAN|nr:phosphate acetyltransferase [Hyella patelloides]VEP12356.1 Phosphate acetyltransferase [Hyella patelloides LEGE 07179]